jgi:tRNA(fMet)-specific endonuclease VapC
MYVLDSDHLSLLQRQTGDDYRILASRCQKIAAINFFVTIISFHEQFNGWTKFVARAKEAASLVRGYTELEGVIDTFARAQVLPFSSAAADVYEDLRTQKVRVGAMDLRIASIAIANQMTLLTRNRVDFERVPGLMFEDWTVPSRNDNAES